MRSIWNAWNLSEWFPDPVQRARFLEWLDMKYDEYLAFEKWRKENKQETATKKG